MSFSSDKVIVSFTTSIVYCIVYYFHNNLVLNVEIRKLLLVRSWIFPFLLIFNLNTCRCWHWRSGLNLPFKLKQSSIRLCISSQVNRLNLVTGLGRNSPVWGFVGKAPLGSRLNDHPAYGAGSMVSLSVFGLNIDLNPLYNFLLQSLPKKVATSAFCLRCWILDKASS
jgi:hypothetical protein